MYFLRYLAVDGDDAIAGGDLRVEGSRSVLDDVLAAFALRSRVCQFMKAGRNARATGCPAPGI